MIIVLVLSLLAMTTNGQRGMGRGNGRMMGGGYGRMMGGGMGRYGRDLTAVLEPNNSK